MIKCDNVVKRSSHSSVSLHCEKLKNAEPFDTMTITLARVQISSSASSLAVVEGPETRSGHAAKLLAILQTEFASCGATHKELQLCFLECTEMKESTFDRAFRELKKRGALRQEGDRYYAISANDGVTCQPVSTGCHDTSRDGVMSSPL